MPAAVPQQSNPSPQQPVPAQPNEPVQKKSNGLKIALVFLVVLLIVILSEVGYLVFSGWGRTFFELKSKQNNLFETESTFLPAVSPTPSVEVSSPENKIQTSKIDNLSYILSSLEPKESFIEEMTIQSIYKAIVVSTSQEDLGSRYVIDGRNDFGETIMFRFSKQEIDSAEITLISNNNQAINFSDIEPNDKISVIVVSDLFDSSLDSKITLEVERSN